MPAPFSATAVTGYSNYEIALGQWKTALCLLWAITTTLAGAVARQAQTPPLPDEQKSNSTSVSLPAPFGRYTDDLDGMVKRGNIRALVMTNPIGFFYDNGQPMGIMYDALEALQTYVNQKLKTRAIKVEVTFIPVRPDQLEASLTQGVGDVVAYSIVITPERKKLVAFTVPIATDVKQVVVSGPKFGTVSSLETLGGKEIYANPLTVPYQALQPSRVTLKPANGGQGKTGQRKWLGTQLFYPAACWGGKSNLVRQLRGPHFRTYP